MTESCSNKRPLKASWMLVLTTFLWGSSFLLMKALVMTQEPLWPGVGTWFLATLSLVFRFGLAALVLLFMDWRAPGRITRSEAVQGAGLGIIGGAGLLIQMDGVNYTPASTSAFLTQCYCVFIPVWVALQRRRLPSGTVMFGTAMVLAGVSVLSGFDFKDMRMGRGELETLVASVFFTAQILWLERPVFSGNDPHRFSLVMFAVIAVMCVPFLPLTGDTAAVPALYASVPAVVLSLMLALLCTACAFTLMNHWQPHVEATHAGLIYCMEPVFTTGFALFLPGLISAAAGVDYPDETLTRQQCIGGGLILTANVMIILRTAKINNPTGKTAS